jgi:hypothetical protein
MTALKPTSTSNQDQPYYSQHDEAVVARLKNFAANQGLGEEVYYPDEDMVGLLQDFGVANPNLDRE